MSSHLAKSARESTLSRTSNDLHALSAVPGPATHVCRTLLSPPLEDLATRAQEYPEVVMGVDLVVIEGQEAFDEDDWAIREGREKPPAGLQSDRSDHPWAMTYVSADTATSGSLFRSSCERCSGSGWPCWRMYAMLARIRGQSILCASAAAGTRARTPCQVRPSRPRRASGGWVGRAPAGDQSRRQPEPRTGP